MLKKHPLPFDNDFMVRLLFTNLKEHQTGFKYFLLGSFGFNVQYLYYWFRFVTFVLYASLFGEDFSTLFVFFFLKCVVKLSKCLSFLRFRTNQSSLYRLGLYWTVFCFSFDFSTSDASRVFNVYATREKLQMLNKSNELNNPFGWCTLILIFQPKKKT